MSDIFISYFHEDRTHAERLAGALEAEGLSVWWIAPSRPVKTSIR